MPRMSIRQFRAALSDAAHEGGAMRAYREITRRPRATSGLRRGDWVPWGAAAGVRQGDWGPWAGDAAQPAARLAGWGDWSGPPSRGAGA